MDQSRDVPEPSALRQRVTWALRRAEFAVQAIKEQGLRPLGLAVPHYSLLMAIHAEPGLAGAELARRLGVTPQAVASLVARLEQRGHLERRAHPRHGHVQELYLTEDGRELLRLADAVISQIEQQIGLELGDETTRLVALLERVIDLTADRSALPFGLPEGNEDRS
ncbi:MarR family winged helix-turn-helix transcriptional regulator [Kutzneria buriramensis]|uniref:MarR family winged helix-turn-helix transcriptional regulator n=1 Tax=Kutzneria buriramensis TaxID=1045776 RepID=UPI001FE85A41|nr:MarR family transcriptional regulator [Kutzneria buriramensis]